MPSAQVGLLSSGMTENDRLAQLDSIADGLLAQFSVHDATDHLLARVNRNLDPFADDLRSSTSAAAAAAAANDAAAEDSEITDADASRSASAGSKFSFAIGPGALPSALAGGDQFDFSSGAGAGFSFGASFDTKMAD